MLSQAVTHLHGPSGDEEVQDALIDNLSLRYSQEAEKSYTKHICIGQTHTCSVALPLVQ